MIPLALDGAFASEQALRDMIAARRVCFDHDPFYVKDGSSRIIQIGFQLNLYAAFQDARHLPAGEDPELHELVGELRRLCRVFFSIVGPSETLPAPGPPDASRHVFSGAAVPGRSLSADPYLRPGTLWCKAGSPTRRIARDGRMSAAAIGGETRTMGRCGDRSAPIRREFAKITLGPPWEDRRTGQ